jgi:hypothetical protein
LQITLPALDFLAVYAAQQQSHVVTRPAFVEQLLEHLDACHHRRARIADAHDLHVLTHL